MSTQSRRARFKDCAYNPRQASETLPASEDRIQVYRSRAAARQAVFRDDDTEEDTRRAVYARQNGLNGKPVPLPRLEDDINDMGVEISTLPRNFFSRLRILRKRKGWTQRELAKRSEISYTEIRYYEYGLAVPRASSIQRLARALKVSVDLLLPEMEQA